MKRVSTIFTTLLIAAVMLFACACAPGAPEYSVKTPDYVSEISAEKLGATLKEFVTKCEDRTTYSAGEKAAAEYIYTKLLDCGYGASGGADGDESTESDAPEEYTADLSVQDMHDADIKKVAGITSDEIHLSSQNVVAQYRPASAPTGAKNVLIGAYYDNRFLKPEGASLGGFKAAGALSNGTGVATLLALAEYLCTVRPQFDFTVTIVFFGASAVDDIGARLFCDNKDNTALISRTVLMVELQRIGVDHVYAFSDARETKREHFFYGISAANGLDVYRPTQKSPIITGVTNLDGVPFVQWAHVGLFSTFFGQNIPTLNLIGANWETINTSDVESAEYGNVSFTSEDTLKNLETRHPDYADKMRTAATLLIRSMESENFIDVMTYDKENFPDTDILTQEWIWYLVALGVVIIAGGIMMLVINIVRKKYPIVYAQPKRMKMAVFGMDYEDKSSADIFIDVRGGSAQEEIFPGVPNNTAAPVANPDPFADVFAGMTGAGMPKNGEVKNISEQDHFGEAPETDLFSVKSDSSEANEEAESASGERDGDSESLRDTSENVENGNGDESAAAKSSVRTDESSDVNKKAPKRTVKQSPSRKTVSAGKSASAKKAVHEKPEDKKPE